MRAHEERINRSRRWTMRNSLLLLAALFALAGCSRDRGLSGLGTEGGIFCDSPSAGKALTPPCIYLPDPTGPAIDRLSFALDFHHRQIYEAAIDESFLFIETDCSDEVVFSNDRSEELAFIGGEDLSFSRGIFDLNWSIGWDFLHFREPYMEATGHPDYGGEEWEVNEGLLRLVFQRRRSHDIVEQNTVIKSRLGEDGIWRVVRWIGKPHPCGVLPEEALYGSWEFQSIDEDQNRLHSTLGFRPEVSYGFTHTVSFGPSLSDILRIDKVQIRGRGEYAVSDDLLILKPSEEWGTTWGGHDLYPALISGGEAHASMEAWDRGIPVEDHDAFVAEFVRQLIENVDKVIYSNSFTEATWSIEGQNLHITTSESASAAVYEKIPALLPTTTLGALKDSVLTGLVSYR